MQKRGQVTIFVIIGIVILIAFALIFVFSSELLKFKSTPENVQLRLNSVYDNIKAEQIDKCIDSETKKAVTELLNNGGNFEIVNFLRYRGENFNILCSAIPGKYKCLSNPVFLNVVEEKLNSRLTKAIFNCIDLSAYYGKDYSVEAGELDAKVSVNPSNVIVDVKYPITIKSGVVDFKKENFEYVLNVPLGEIIKVTNDVLNSEAALGVFEPLSYGVFSLNKFNVEVKKPYPNKLYFVSLTQYPQYVMKFAVTGNSRFDE